jgi:hypothetical protein
MPVSHVNRIRGPNVYHVVVRQLRREKVAQQAQVRERTAKVDQEERPSGEQG